MFIINHNLWFNHFLWKGFQKWIGYVDVKSSPVHFYVQRNSSLYTSDSNTIIPFQVEVVNEGKAMNLTSGIFTAPRPGIYFFSFSGVARFTASSSRDQLAVDLFLNGGRIGVGNVDEANTVDQQKSTLTLQSTLKLKKGDQVWLTIFMSYIVFLHDSDYHYTHFTGFMLEEDIVASLWELCSHNKKLTEKRIFFMGEGYKI